MKKLLIAAFTLSLISCTKTALVPQKFQSVHQKWIVQEGHDVNTFSHATFCFAEDYLNIDTIDLYYAVEPDNPNKFSYQPDDIYFHVPNGRVPTGIPDIYDRNYCQLLKQID